LRPAETLRFWVKLSFTLLILHFAFTCMLNKKDIQDWINKKCDAITRHLNSFCTTYKDEDLHKLRLEIKKIKALVFLLEKTSKGNIPPFAEIGLSDLFKHTGRIRDAQQRIKLFTQHDVNNPSIINQQQEIKQKEERELFQRKQEYQLQIERARTLLGDYSASIKNKEALELIRKQYDKLAISLPGTIEISDLHNQRKKIKRFLYMLDILPETLTQGLRFNKEYFEEVAKKIGDWHDSILAADLLNLPQIKHKADTQLNEITSLVIGFESKSLL
jgi:CHAD domain-containing protein